MISPRLAKWLREINLPTAAILEGGYSVELPELIDMFLSSWDSGRARSNGSDDSGMG
jgi:hypothetical protein